MKSKQITNRLLLPAVLCLWRCSWRRWSIACWSFPSQTCPSVEPVEWKWSKQRKIYVNFVNMNFQGHRKFTFFFIMWSDDTLSASIWHDWGIKLHSIAVERCKQNIFILSLRTKREILRNSAINFYFRTFSNFGFGFRIISEQISKLKTSLNEMWNQKVQILTSLNFCDSSLVLHQVITDLQQLWRFTCVRQRRLWCHHLKLGDPRCRCHWGVSAEWKL